MRDFDAILAAWLGATAGDGVEAAPRGGETMAQMSQSQTDSPVMNRFAGAPPGDCPAAPASLEAIQAALAARWEDAAASWFACMGRHAEELTAADQRRAVALEARIVEAIIAGDERACLAAIAEWQRATTPLRWLPHGRWYADLAEDGWAVPNAAREAVYEAEAALRGVPASRRCSGNGECGGACTAEG